MNIKQIVLFAVLTLTTLSIANPLKKMSCADTLEQLNLRYETSTKSLHDLDSLINDSSIPQGPLTVLFQIDLNNNEKLLSRIEELKLLTTPSSIAGSDEFKQFEQCFPKSEKITDLISLRVKINSKKLEYLNFSEGKRNVLAENYENKRKVSLENLKLEDEIKQAKDAISQVELNEGNPSTTSTTNDQTDNIQTLTTLLTGIQTDNEKKYLSFLDFFKQKKEILDKLKGNAVPEQDKKTIELQLVEVNENWRTIVDELQGLFTRLNSFTFESIPSYKEELGNEVSLSFKSSIKTAKKRQKEITKNVTNNIESLKRDSFLLLSKVGKRRSYLLKICDKNEGTCSRKRGLNQGNIDDFIRELRIIPLKIEAGTAAKWFEVKRKFYLGLDGWMDLFYQIIILLLILLSPLIVSKFLDWITSKVNSFRKNLVSKSIMDYRHRTSLAVWLSRLIPFITPVGMVLVTSFAEGLLAKTDVPELASAVFYLQIYYYYRISRIIIKASLQAIFSAKTLAKTDKDDITGLARKISRLVFVQIAIFHLISDTAREALVYSFFINVAYLANILFILKESYAWKEDIIHIFSLRFPEIYKRFSSLTTQYYSFLLFPFMLLASIIDALWNVLALYLSKLDFTKKVLSEILKKKLQSADIDNQKLVRPSENYLAYFDYYLPAKDAFFIDREASLIKSVDQMIKKWLAGTDQDDLAIVVGNRGMGKTTTLQKIHGLQTPSEQILLTKIPTRTLDKESLYAWISSLLGSNINSIEEFLDIDKQSKKRVILVDDLQNLFLSTIGGFEAYEIFTELICLKTKNIFWCLTVNSRSWAYLKGVYGKEHFYGNIMQLNPWKDYEIQSLIVKRHDQSKFKRVYDKSIKAYGTTDSVGQQAEGQFFRLLWGQSRGNPRSALMYWISAISQPEENLIHVGVPDFVDSSLVGSMSDEGHFLLASIARHESLKYEELVRVTGISSSTVRKCLKEFEDKNLTWTDEEKRIRITSKSQYVIDYFLIGKNFLYE